jgi:hypothetical protein
MALCPMRFAMRIVVAADRPHDVRNYQVRNARFEQPCYGTVAQVVEPALEGVVCILIFAMGRLSRHCLLALESPDLG